MRAFDAIQRGAGSHLPAREEPQSLKQRTRQGSGRFFLFLLALAGLGFLLIRPSAPSASTSKTGHVSALSSTTTTVPSLHLPQGGNLSAPLDKLVVLDHPNEFSVPQTDQSTSTETPASATPPAADFTVRILNGGGAAGAAGKLRDDLKAKGFTVSAIGNAQSNYLRTTVYYQTGKQSSAEKIVDALGQPTPALTENSIAAPADVLVVLGADR